MHMKKNQSARLAFLFIVSLAVSTMFSCKSRSDSDTKKDGQMKIGSELKSIGGKGDDVLSFDLHCKSEGSKLYWILQARQKVCGVFGFRGWSGPDAEDMASRIFKEIQATNRIGSDENGRSSLKNKIKIEFTDQNGFKVVDAVANEISHVDRNGEKAEPTEHCWFYRGVIDLDSHKISKIAKLSIVPGF